MSFWLGRISHMRRLTVLSSWPSDLPLNLDDLDGTAKKLLEIVKGAEGSPKTVGLTHARFSEGVRPRSLWRRQQMESR